MIIRSYQLKIGNRFIKQSVKHIVVRLQDGKYMCRHLSDSATAIKHSGKGSAQIGFYSQERVAFWNCI